MKTRVIAFCNQKGGVAKTTSVINVGAALARAGRRVLLVDADAQGSLTVSVGLEEHVTDQTVTTYELLLENGDASDAIWENVGSGYDVIAADIRLSAADLKLVSVPGRETVLRDALEAIAPAYDYILIDCPPNLSIVTMNAKRQPMSLLYPSKPTFWPLAA